MKSKPKKRSSNNEQQMPSNPKVGSKSLDCPMKLVGVGMFDSGISDLGSNKKYLEGFGQKSMGRRDKALKTGS
jgi:hypothetical protein